MKILLGVFLVSVGSVVAGVGDPQVRTDHPWYPGELAMSTFERLAETQAEAWERVTGKAVVTEEDKALAAWFWRNTHYAHGEDGRANTYGEGFAKGEWNREYWQGLFGHGFGLCGTTHAQWTAEMQHLLGHCRGRSVGVSGHNSFEVFLRGGAYGDEGRWVLLDHDLSTVVFDEKGERLVSIGELVPALGTLGDPDFKSGRQRGWRVAGLHPGDMASFSSFRVAEYFSGYAGAPPMVHLRKGERMRRYLEPGLEDGETFVFWGRNYGTDGVPGPERSRSWVNQPEKMYGATRDAGHVDGRVRYANAVFTYAPDFSDGSYREGVVDEGEGFVVFEFSSPYVIGATPVDGSDWGIYDAGGTNGLVVTCGGDVRKSVSTDRGVTWQAGEGDDLTDLVKGHSQYRLRLEAGAEVLAGTGLVMRTVCQANVATVPRLHDGVNRIGFAASGRAVVSAGPNVDQAAAQVVDGEMGSARVTLELAAPRGEKVVGIVAASHNQSGSPPREEVAYAIGYSLDGGKRWAPVVEGWRVLRRGEEPGDFWSQSFTYGAVALDRVDGPVRVRFSNDGGKRYRRVEAHLVYEVAGRGETEVRFGWTNGAGGDVRVAGQAFGDEGEWELDAGEAVRTRWVEMGSIE